LNVKLTPREVTWSINFSVSGFPRARSCLLIARCNIVKGLLFAQSRRRLRFCARYAIEYTRGRAHAHSEENPVCRGFLQNVPELRASRAVIPGQRDAIMQRTGHSSSPPSPPRSLLPPLPPPRSPSGCPPPAPSSSSSAIDCIVDLEALEEITTPRPCRLPPRSHHVRL